MLLFHGIIYYYYRDLFKLKKEWNREKLTNVHLVAVLFSVDFQCGAKKNQ